MVKDIMKMAGVKSKKEFYAKYPTEESFLEAFPQAVKMFPQMAKGGATDEIAFPQAPVTGAFFNYGPPTMNVPRLFQPGGQQDAELQEYYDSGKFWKNPITGKTIQEGARPTSSPIDWALFAPAALRTLPALNSLLFPNMRNGKILKAINRSHKYNKKQPGRQEGGAAPDAMEEVINAVAQQLQIDPNQIMAMLQQNPQAIAQLEQLVAQDPNQAVQALAQMVEQSMGGQVPQEGEGMSPEEQAMMEQQAMQGQGEEMAPMMAYGGNPFVDSPLDKFVRGGCIDCQPKYQVAGGVDAATASKLCKEQNGPDYEYDPASGQCINKGPKTPLEKIQKTLSDIDLSGIGTAALAGLVGQRVLAGGRGAAGAMELPKSPVQKWITGFEKNNPVTGGFIRGVTGIRPAPKGRPSGKTPTKVEQAKSMVSGAAGPALGVGAYMGGKYLTTPYEDVYRPLIVPQPAAQDATQTQVQTTVPPTYYFVPEENNNNRKAYGGGISANPFNYGAYAPPMAYGGSNAPMGDTDYTPVSNERIDALMRFVQGGMQRAQQEEMMNYMMGIEPEEMKRGGSKKKKG